MDRHEISGWFGLIRSELAHHLLIREPQRAISVSIEDGCDENGAPAWGDVSGHVSLSRELVNAAIAGDAHAVEALAHQVVHGIGTGSAFAYLEEQLLEEAATEVIAQCWSPWFLEFFGIVAPPAAVLFGVTSGDVAVARPTAANVSVERFGRIAAWLDELDVDAEAEEIEEAALKWAIKVKSTRGEDRFALLARAAASLESTDEDGSASEFLDRYLRGYMKQLTRSQTGFDGLEYALRRAWFDDSVRPVARALDRHGWRVELEAVERVTLHPLPKKGLMPRVLRTPMPPDVLAAVRRSLDARSLLWSARALDVASGC